MKYRSIGASRFARHAAAVAGAGRKSRPPAARLFSSDGAAQPRRRTARLDMRPPGNYRPRSFLFSYRHRSWPFSAAKWAVDIAVVLHHARRRRSAPLGRWSLHDDFSRGTPAMQFLAHLLLPLPLHQARAASMQHFERRYAPAPMPQGGGMRMPHTAGPSR